MTAKKSGAWDKDKVSKDGRDLINCNRLEIFLLSAAIFLFHLSVASLLSNLNIRSINVGSGESIS